MTYEVIGWLKEAVKDNWYAGETGKTVVSSGTDRFIGNTVDELVERLQDVFWCGYCQIALNSVSEIVLERIEDDNGDRVDKNDRLYDDWQAGKCDLWIARYYFNVEETLRKPAQLDQKEYEL